MFLVPGLDLPRHLMCIECNEGFAQTSFREYGVVGKEKVIPQHLLQEAVFVERFSSLIFCAA